MKPTFPLLALFLGTASLSAQAQMPDRQNPVPAIVRAPEAATAAEVTREMTKRLHLNEAQYLQLLPVNRIRMAQLRGINRQYKHDEATRNVKIAELDAYYQQECSRILTPSQLSQLHDNQQPGEAPVVAENGLG